MPIPASSVTQAAQTDAAAKARGAEPCRSTQRSGSSAQRPHGLPSPDEYVPFAMASTVSGDSFASSSKYFR